MKSHEYEVSGSDLARLAARIAAPVLLFAVLMRLGVMTDLWPRPWPALDLDRTILTHQAYASRGSNDSDLVLIGDSSCLMDVSAVKLQQQLGGRHRPLNLATFMYMGFGGYASMLSRYDDVNPGRVRVVVLLLHPEMLRGIAPVSNYLRTLSDLYAGTDPEAPSSVHGQLCGLLGLNVFESSIPGALPLAPAGSIRTALRLQPGPRQLHGTDTGQCR